MEPKDIHELVELLSRSNLSSLEIEREGFRLKLVKKAPVVGAPQTVVTTSEVVAAPSPVVAVDAGGAPPPTEPGLYELTTPFVGTYYSAPNPDAPPFVTVGKTIAKGDVLCIVEAMKLMNEIEADINGEVVEILANNGQPVEYGEVLFRIRQS